MLQKDIPLINLLNYSFTFDKYVVERLGIGAASVWNEANSEVFDPSEEKITDVKSAFGRLLVHPYAGVSYDHFSNWHMRIALGATGSDIPMDRPKYFSDQIIGKACLQDLNPSDSRAIAGPSTVYQNVSNSNLLAKIRAFVRAHLEAADVTAAVGFVGANVPVYNQNPPEIKDIFDRYRTYFTGAAANAAGDLIDFTIGYGGAGGAGVAVTEASVNALATAAIAKLNAFADVDNNIKRFVSKAINGHAAFVKKQIKISVPAPAQRISDDYKYSYNATGANIRQYFARDYFARSILIELASHLLGSNTLVPNLEVKALHYFKDSDQGEVKAVRLDPANNATYNAYTVGVLGKTRYDTKLIRNLSWFSHLHRFLLWSLKESLRNSSQPVVSNLGVIDPSLIDFRGYQSVDKKEYHL